VASLHNVIGYLSGQDNHRMCKTVEWPKFRAYAYEEDRDFEKSISESAIKGPCTSRAFDR
jgi:hypothetical protein